MSRAAHSSPFLLCRRSLTFTFLVVAAFMFYVLVPYQTRSQGGRKVHQEQFGVAEWGEDSLPTSEKRATESATSHCESSSRNLPSEILGAVTGRKLMNPWVMMEATRAMTSLKIHQHLVQSIAVQRPDENGAYASDHAEEAHDEEAVPIDDDILLSSYGSHSSEMNLLSEQFQLVINVLTYDRLESLARCLESLAHADYGGDTVKLRLYIDHFGLLVHSGDKDDVLDMHLMTGLAILSYADQFQWVHGPKEVHFRTDNVGLQGQWLEAWWPSTDHEFALMVEDDMELSPLFYRYLRSVIATYFYNPLNSDPSIFGISLQRPRFVPGRGGRPLHVDNSTRLFLYQLVGTWGQLLFPKPWKEFRIWYDIHKAKGIKPFLEGMVTNRWYRKLGERIWTPWFIKFVHARHYYNLYTNFLEDRALIVSHRDAGVNYKSNIGPDSQLICANGTTDIDLWEMVPLKSLQRYDFCFQPVVPKTVVRNRPDKLQPLLAVLHVKNEVVLVSTLGVPKAMVRNWLCHFQRFGLHNYLLLGDDILLLKELGRRGHAVMQPMLDRQEKKLQLKAQEDSIDITALRRDILTVSSIKSIVGFGYNVLFTKADNLWLKNPFRENNRWGYADLVAVADGTGCSAGFMYFQSTERTNGFLGCAADNLWSQGSMGSMAKDSDDTTAQAWASKVCKCGVQTHAAVLRLDPIDSPFFSKLEAGDVGSPVGPTNATMLFAGWRYKTRDLVHAMQGRGLWLVDDDLACTRVTCLPKQQVQEGS